MKKRFLLGCAVMSIVSMAVCGSSFAVEIPDGFTRNEVLSAQALEMAKQQFTLLEQQLVMIAQSSPPEQQVTINQALSMVKEKLARLDRVDVYLADEATPGASYETIYDFYKGILSNVQDVDTHDMQFAVTQVPPGLIPPATLNSLMALLSPESAYEVKAAIGTSGKSRVSISTVYINSQTFELIKGTTLVIATDK
ncbi:hypothetical protein CSB45_02325 [candidate division KSB3 bacterium]|uniref:Uncharacterized protein n=1 Tax=candidate division KSB3 bacterium TaxID=2044937 RepID=A0A2G6E9V7_9BACT|nr:MAG: hypothetical protein CSB45_02325 [candidate division KSB3 bacterium]PIE30916.1 MAG: hypothetical protein CSA57_00935 [candidate division KSB3 bacterium]